MNLYVLNSLDKLEASRSNKTIGALPQFNAIKQADSNLLIARGHVLGTDPGTIGYADGGLVKETDVIGSTIDSLAGVFLPKQRPIILAVWSALSVIIQLFNGIFARTKKKILIQIHSDMPVSDIQKRPLTVGFYYGSEKGRIEAEKIKKGIQNRNSDIQVWIRHQSLSPRKKLGLITNTMHVALIAEIDFVNRPSFLREVVQNVFSEALYEYDVNYSA